MPTDTLTPAAVLAMPAGTALEREMVAVKGRDAAVAEAVRGERERCLAILGSNEFWDAVEDAIRRGE